MRAGGRAVAAGVLAAMLVVVAVVLGGCSGPVDAPQPVFSSRSVTASPEPIGQDDWPTYHHDNARTGVASQLAPLGVLGRAWQAPLDGAVYGQPLVIGTTVIAATENDTVYGLAVGDGHVLWS
ncbi:MAG TPA: hypothetical protein VII33_01300, partial [Nakamurella sp.]